MQLYTSKSFANRRSELLNPNEDNGKQHVLSPRLVDAISQTAQVVWANTRKQEGLIGRSDIRLQTAVGMPVAIDAQGNMCIVVMFSPSNMQSTDDAMEYLQSISRSATTSSIPCLMPVFDTQKIKQLPPPETWEHPPLHPDASSLGEGVTARFVSLDQHDNEASPEKHSDHVLSLAPKDTFGIPMLPSFAELGAVTVPEDEDVDVFDEASYGIWNTIMETMKDGSVDYDASGNNYDLQRDLQTGNPATWAQRGETGASAAVISEARKERLEEFCQAFLGMSVFDLADVWVPVSSDALGHVMSVSNNPSLASFETQSELSIIKNWTGAVGRAFASGNPVWSANPSVFQDPGRSHAFDQAGIRTVLAIPVFADRSSPSCVVSCYSLVRSGSVPFVLKFVQQALRLLWDGLDQVQQSDVQPHVWESVAPADLGEMAADVEMQQHFVTRKRTFTMLGSSSRNNSLLADPEPLMNMQSIELPSGEKVSMPLQFPDESESSAAEVDIDQVQNHLYDAVRSVGDVMPFSPIDHRSTNNEGTKRAHVGLGPIGQSNGPLPLHMPKPLPTVNQVLSSAHVPSVNGTSASTSSSSIASTMSVEALRPSLPISGPVPMGPPPAPYVSSSSLSSTYNNASGLMAAPSSMSFNNYSTDVSSYCLPVASVPDKKVCRIQGCDDPVASRRPYCVRHSGNRLCEREGCGKCAQGSTRFCIAHGGGRRCTFPGCDKGARDKFFCAAHGGGKRCKHDGCSKSAVGGSSLCTAHGGGKRCAVTGCDKSAQSSTNFCVKHGGGKKCAYEGCEKVARGRTSFCAAHGGGVRCKLEGCNRVAIGKNQLCRAHGGGSRSKKRRNDASPIQAPVVTGVQPLSAGTLNEGGDFYTLNLQADQLTSV